MNKFSKSLGDISVNENEPPLATSSPNSTKVSVSEAANIMSVEDIETMIKAEKEKVIEKLDKAMAEKINGLKAITKKLSSIKELDRPATFEDFKVLRKLTQQKYKEAEKMHKMKNNAKKKDPAELQEEASLTLGSIVESHNFETDPSSSSNIQQNIKEKKMVKFTNVNDTGDDENVFKKPKARKGAPDEKDLLFQTPVNRNKHGYNVAVVTPGPNSQKPVNILRRPNPGEMAISMSGSPLLVAHTNMPLNAPQISIPLSDGRVMTVVADKGLDPDMSLCSDIDPETKEHLLVLQQILKKKTK